MIGIDTNVLVRYVVRDDEPQYAVAAEALESLTETSPGFIAQVVLAELYWVLARSYRYPAATCLAVIRSLVATASLEFDDAEGVVRALELAEAGADFGDALIQGAMELFGVVETVTFDRGAARGLGWRVLGGPDESP
ncbi:PIN domain-containing protein [Nocardioides bizhenqiangii]|uniref:Ribonuclease VapC n=1 Tax=Nocardioides bizhenqiangii TaxID=3095076 RepID=A0ABZ0ZR02_9ACTN|nr:type II toxin-antitoxin system VapC family toxin [Nocardioides sp. HM61]WQQ26520.1 type II toxin-antitoxin system VapC family toxin [Nocardioides sp. HM61]